MCAGQWLGIIPANMTLLAGRSVPMATMVTFALRNGEKRLYKDVTRVDDTRPHLVLVYSNNVLIAQLHKHDVVIHRQTPRILSSLPRPIGDA
jgi:hypothetical protein